MMKPGTIILYTAARYIVPLQLLFSVFLLLRGHDEPGGGFIAGLVASAAIALYMFTFGATVTRDLLRVDPRHLIGIGLFFGMISIFPALFVGEPFFTAQWWYIDLPGGSQMKLSTPLIFDIGVYFAVFGSVMLMLIALTETEER